MSAIKKETFQIVGGDNIEIAGEDGDTPHTMIVRSILVSRGNPSSCQIFAEMENSGSLSASTKVYTGKIMTVTPGKDVSEFVVKAKVASEFQSLSLKCQKTESSDCCIC